MTALIFNDTELTVITRNNETWLKGAQIARGLGYADPDRRAVEIYQRHADEFTDDMAQLVEVDTATGAKTTRVFSLRGAYLMAMLSKTDRAKEFRAWVLDQLTEAQSKPARVALAEALRLHPRYSKILRYWGLGLSRSEMSRMLNISTSTLHIDLGRLYDMGLIQFTDNKALASA